MSWPTNLSNPTQHTHNNCRSKRYRCTCTRRCGNRLLKRGSRPSFCLAFSNLFPIDGRNNMLWLTHTCLADSAVHWSWKDVGKHPHRSTHCKLSAVVAFVVVMEWHILVCLRRRELRCALHHFLWVFPKRAEKQRGEIKAKHGNSFYKIVKRASCFPCYLVLVLEMFSVQGLIKWEWDFPDKIWQVWNATRRCF